jgi:hypothetical protein
MNCEKGASMYVSRVLEGIWLKFMMKSPPGRQKRKGVRPKTVEAVIGENQNLGFHRMSQIQIQSTFFL